MCLMKNLGLILLLGLSTSAFGEIWFPAGLDDYKSNTAAIWEPAKDVSKYKVFELQKKIEEGPESIDFGASFTRRKRKERICWLS